MYVVVCPYCGNICELRVDKNKSGANKTFYACPHCEAQVMANSRTLAPLGFPANKELRKVRISTHTSFDKFLDEKGMSKKNGYEWLSKKMCLPKSKTHIANFNIQQCKQVINLCNAELEKKVAV